MTPIEREIAEKAYEIYHNNEAMREFNQSRQFEYIGYVSNFENEETDSNTITFDIPINKGEQGISDELAKFSHMKIIIKLY